MFHDGVHHSYLNAVNVSAPKEQNVYSFRAVLHGAPSGAQCAFARSYKHQAPTELFTRISTSSSYRAVYSYLNPVNVSAPKEQNVYSFRVVLHGAPSGAQCAFAQSYKHQAPTELFTRISTSSSYGAVYSYLNAVNVSAPKEQHVYSFRAVLDGAPSGAQCAFAQCYKHQAPTELFTRISTSSSYGAVYSYLNIKFLRSCLFVSQHQVPTELFTRISTLLTSLRSE